MSQHKLHLLAFALLLSLLVLCAPLYAKKKQLPKLTSIKYDERHMLLSHSEIAELEEIKSQLADLADSLGIDEKLNPRLLPQQKDELNHLDDDYLDIFNFAYFDEEEIVFEEKIPLAQSGNGTSTIRAM